LALSQKYNKGLNLETTFQYSFNIMLYLIQCLI
jgi:hypothetical protein